MDATSRIAELIAPALQSMGYELVRVRLTGGTRPVLQVMAERPDGTMNVDDCAEVSGAVSALLDVEDPIAGAYTLEVSSPGIDRPLTRPGDFERFAGFEARVEMVQPLDGRKRFQGRLLGIEDGAVRLVTEQGEMRIPMGEVGAAKLVLTDELIAASLRRKN